MLPRRSICVTSGTAGSANVGLYLACIVVIFYRSTQCKTACDRQTDGRANRNAVQAIAYALLYFAKCVYAYIHNIQCVPKNGWLGSRVVSVLDSGAEGP